MTGMQLVEMIIVHNPSEENGTQALNLTTLININPDWADTKAMP